MAKQSTTCETCGGKTDGTPSGTMRHYKTQVHMKAVEALANQPVETVEVLPDAEVVKSALAPERAGELEPGSTERADAETRLAELDKMLARRRYSVKYRERFEPAKADSYRERKYLPVLQERNAVAASLGVKAVE